MVRIINNESVHVRSKKDIAAVTQELEAGFECNVQKLYYSMRFECRDDDHHVDDFSKLVCALMNKPTLEDLHIISRNYLSFENTTCISNLLDLNVNPLGRLQHFQFEGGDWMTNEHFVEISKGLKNNNYLVTLKIQAGKIGESGAKCLGNALATNHSLVLLALRKVGIGDAGAESIAVGIMERQYPSHSNIARHFSTQPSKEFELYLRCNDKIGVIGAKAFASLLHKQHSALSPLVTLTTLNLSYCSVGDEGAVAIAESIKSYNTDIGLKKLYLSGNRIGNTGAIAFANALKQNKVLRHLDLHCNEIGLDGGMALCQKLEAYNNTPRFVSLPSNPCSILMWNNDMTIENYLFPSPRNCDKKVATEENQRIKVNDIFKFIASR